MQATITRHADFTRASTQTRTPWKESRVVTVGEWFRRAREQRGLSKRALAKAAGVSDPMVGYIESGKRDPSPEIVGKLVRGLAQDDTDARWVDEKTAEVLAIQYAQTAGTEYLSDAERRLLHAYRGQPEGSPGRLIFDTAIDLTETGEPGDVGPDSGRFRRQRRS